MRRPTLIEVYGFFGSICGLWGTGQQIPPWAEVPGLDISYDKIDKLLFTNYGDRPVSRCLLEYLKLGNGKLRLTDLPIISGYVLDINRLSWARLTADFAAQYDPIENYRLHEETGGTDDTTRAYEDYKETVKMGHTVETDDGGNLYGFDNDDTSSPDGAKSTKDVTKTTYGKATDSGDTREYDGTYTDTTTYGRTLDRYGNIGTLTNSRMIAEDAALWSAENFFEKIAADIAAVLTIPIYE